jgi:hypothetical protein
MKTGESNNAHTETNMYAMPITRRVAVLHRILWNSFVIQQNTVSSRQHIKSYSSMLHAHCVFSIDHFKIVNCCKSDIDLILNKPCTLCLECLM